MECTNKREMSRNAWPQYNPAPQNGEESATTIHATKNDPQPKSPTPCMVSHRKHEDHTPKPKRCLIEIHNAPDIKDLLKMTEHLHNLRYGGIHLPVYSCPCNECEPDWENGCENPQKCAMEAHQRLERIAPKYNPLQNPQQDNLSLIKRRKAQNAQTKQNNNAITFNPSITSKTNLAECFHIFTNNEELTITLAERQPPTNSVSLIDLHQTIYTDSSCINNRDTNTQCSTGIWFRRDSERNTSVRIAGEHLTNQIGELAAITVALEKTLNFIPLTIKSNSKYAIDGLTTHLERWENIGWLGIWNKEWFMRAAYLLRKDLPPPTSSGSKDIMEPKNKPPTK
jgi:ribonuclease HI